MNTINYSLGRRIIISFLLLSFPSIQAEDLRDPKNALSDFEVYPGLEVTQFASEPMILSPSNLDIDHRGRVWICEVVNYHRNRGRRKEGDRILILEDTDGDGRADSKKVFYQGLDVDSAMGICVLGSKVIVTSSPNVILFSDVDGDDKPDKKEVLFTKTGHPEHDHSAHSFVFGPDRKLYWNFGNTGQGVYDRNGQVIKDVFGHAVLDNRQPYQGGMVFRCNPDGSNFEVLGHNFRNNYELAVDSFGTVWQTDNDDDGNQGSRMSYVMEYGNYGYRDELNGYHWKRTRTGQSENVSARHFHQNDPGVVPNLIVTGNGAPTGITIYEGDLLPKEFKGMPVHGDSVTNAVYLNLITPKGAGYSGKFVPVLKSKKDRWFRPIDISVAPDGSLYITDWYDPGVGGHRQADIQRGRIYRVAPKGHTPKKIKSAFNSISGAIEGLKSPNQEIRFLSSEFLFSQKEKAEPQLEELVVNSNPIVRARAFWLLGKIEGRGQNYVNLAIQDESSDIRILGLRLARQLNLDTFSIVQKLIHDPSPQVRRECAIALRSIEPDRRAPLWARLAQKHDGTDRWYLEALGIGAKDAWKECFSAWLDINGALNFKNSVHRDIIWRSRSPEAIPLLALLIQFPSISPKERLRYFRAFDFHLSAEKNDILLDLMISLWEKSDPNYKLAGRHYRGKPPQEEPRFMALVEVWLKEAEGTGEYLNLLHEFQLKEKADVLLEKLLVSEDEDFLYRGVTLLDLWGMIDKVISLALDSNSPHSRKAVQLLGKSRSRKIIVPFFVRILSDENRSLAMRAVAIKSLGNSIDTQKELLNLIKAKKVPPELHHVAGDLLIGSRFSGIANHARQLLNMPQSLDQKKLPPMAELLKMKGSSQRGRHIFKSKGNCITCHKVNGQGKEVGPDLSSVGGKLDRSSLLESILFPGIALSHGYEGVSVITKKGLVLSGVLREKTDKVLTLVTEKGEVQTFNRTDLVKETLLRESVMPRDLYKLMTQRELMDLVAYMETLKAEK